MAPQFHRIYHLMRGKRKEKANEQVKCKMVRSNYVEKNKAGREQGNVWAVTPKREFRAVRGLSWGQEWGNENEGSNVFGPASALIPGELSCVCIFLCGFNYRKSNINTKLFENSVIIYCSTFSKVISLQLFIRSRLFPEN